MPQPPRSDTISEIAPVLKTRTPPTRDPHSMKARKGFRTLDVTPSRRPITREYARKR